MLPVDDVVAGQQVHSEDSAGAEGPGHQPGPIRDEYSGHVTCIDQSEASIYLGGSCHTPLLSARHSLREKLLVNREKIEMIQNTLTLSYI